VVLCPTGAIIEGCNDEEVTDEEVTDEEARLRAALVCGRDTLLSSRTTVVVVVVLISLPPSPDTKSYFTSSVRSERPSGIKGKAPLTCSLLLLFLSSVFEVSSNASFSKSDFRLCITCALSDGVAEKKAS
jgi:hypothetical protein